MTVSSKAIINKMIDELQKAKTVDGDLSKVKVYLEKVQVLSELLLEETAPTSVVTEVHHQLTENPPTRVMQAEPNIVEDQGDSIFDF